MSQLLENNYYSLVVVQYVYWYYDDRAHPGTSAVITSYGGCAVCMYRHHTKHGRVHPGMSAVCCAWMCPTIVVSITHTEQPL